MAEENELLAYCGLYCGDCHGYKGKIPDLARDLRKELRAAHYDRFAASFSQSPFGKPLAHYMECYDALGLMMKFRCKKGCRKGGGPPFCKIRICCQEKGIAGCWECDEFESCKKPEFLVPVHGDAHIKNLRAVKKKGVKGFLSGKRYWETKKKE